MARTRDHEVNGRVTFEFETIVPASSPEQAEERVRELLTWNFGLLSQRFRFRRARRTTDIYLSSGDPDVVIDTCEADLD